MTLNNNKENRAPPPPSPFCLQASNSLCQTPGDSPKLQLPHKRSVKRRNPKRGCDFLFHTQQCVPHKHRTWELLNLCWSAEKCIILFYGFLSFQFGATSSGAQWSLSATLRGPGGVGNWSGAQHAKHVLQPFELSPSQPPVLFSAFPLVLFGMWA